MKLLIFAHTPPPHHGQSYMVQLLVQGLGGDARMKPTSGTASEAAGGIECYHVNARLSDDLQQVGRAGWSKPIRLMRYCAEALWCRFRYGVYRFYYVPAPDLRVAVYRDFMVLAICRPFFRSIVYHHHALGLGRWLKEEANFIERFLGKWLLCRPSLSVVLGAFNQGDARILAPERLETVPNGIPDPCQDYEQSLRDRRKIRATARTMLFAGETPSAVGLDGAGEDPEVFRILFVGLCCREKGLFDAVEAVAMLAARLKASGSRVRVRLEVAGRFYREAEQREFEERVGRDDLRSEGANLVRHLGFVEGARKSELFRNCDCLCFPTYYSAESFGLVLVEAMAYGMPCVASRWRTIPELFGEGYAGLVEPQSPGQLANTLEAFLKADYTDAFRERFLRHYTLERWLTRMREVLGSVQK